MPATPLDTILFIVTGAFMAVVLAYTVVFLVRGERKVCPDCAERVRGDAQVCKHCGHRFKTD